MTERKQCRLEGLALELGKEVCATVLKSNKFQEELREEFQLRSDSEAARLKDMLDRLFTGLMTAAGLPAEDRAKWALDVRYFNELGIMIMFSMEEGLPAEDAWNPNLIPVGKPN